MGGNTRHNRSNTSSSKQEGDPGSHPPTPPITPATTTTMPPTNASSASGRSTPTLSKIVTNPVVTGSIPQTQVGTTSANQTTGGGSSRARVPSAASAREDQTTSSVNALLLAMQRALGALGTTFDVLGEQTISVATLGPAVIAVKKIEQVRKDVQAQSLRQEARAQTTRGQLQTRVAAHIREVLRPKVDNMIADAVGKLVDSRVRLALEAQIPQDIKEKLAHYRRRIDEVRIALVNAEARRHNALIPHDAELRPLLRPLPPPGTEAEQKDGAAGANGDAQGSDRDGKTMNKSKNKDKDKPAGAGDTPNAAAGAPVNGAGAGTPSELFPRTVHDLRELDARKAHRLVVEYGVAPTGEGGEVDEDWEDIGADGKEKVGTKPQGTNGRAAGGPGGRGAGASAGGSGSGGPPTESDKAKRESRRIAELNEFMKFIGVSSFFSCIHLCLFFFLASRRLSSRVAWAPERVRPWPG
ncbi:hypothetical protein OH77DRAFT_1153786 [Trametes cingulata]|nr:hypothetical protein OH77DRAFT_1153786 [Trametes cingulata]